MAVQIRIKVQEADFDIGAETAALYRGDAATGAVATFTGLVRNLEDSPLTAMVLEHYPGMTENALQRIAEQAADRWPLARITVIHRVGRLLPQEQIVFVGVASAHRDAAFASCQFIMDYLKRDAPFWKKECTPAGDRWVEQKASDLDSAASWDR